MRRICNARRAFAVAAGLSIVLWLAACGGVTKVPKEGQQTRQASARSSQSRSSAQSSSSAAAKSEQPAGSSEQRELSARAAGVTYISRCLEAHGIRIPPQSLNRDFTLRGVDTHSSQFKRAYPGCLHGARGVYEAMLRD